MYFLSISYFISLSKERVSSIKKSHFFMNDNITSDGVKYNLKKLVLHQIIERIGPDNGGYWEIK